MIQSGGSSFSDAADHKHSAANPAEDLPEDGSEDGALAGDSPDVVDAAEQLDAPVRQGTCSIYKSEAGTSIAVSQAEHYADRSFALLCMSFDEFVMTMHVAKKPTKSEQEDVEEAPKAGRPQHRAYELLSPHPLAEHYVIKEKSKFDVPILVGQPPPRLPPPLTGNGQGKHTPARKRKERLHAAYFTALFVPWHGHSADRVDNSPQAWLEYTAHLEDEAAAVCSTSQQHVWTRIAQGRIFRIEQVSKALTSYTSKAKVMSQWRCRNRTLWAESHSIDALAGEPARGRGSEKAEQDIADIRVQAARRADARAV